MARDAEEHEAWAAKVAQALFEAAEDAAAGFFPESEADYDPDGSIVTTFTIEVKGEAP